MTDELKVRTNLPDFQAQLRAIGSDFAQRAVRSATGAAASAFAKAIRKQAPTLKGAHKGRVAGALKRNVFVKRSKERTPGREHYFVGIRTGGKSSGSPFYWRFLEGGWIPRGRGQGLKGGRRSKALQRERARAGGARTVKFPFIAPGYEAAKNAAVDVFYQRLTKKVAEYSRKI